MQLSSKLGLGIAVGLLVSACSATTAPSPSPMTAASAPGKPGGAPQAAATYAPEIVVDTTRVDATRILVPPIQGRPLSADLMDVNQLTNMLYLADQTDRGIDIFDVSANPPTYLRTIPVPAGPLGVTVAPDLNKLFVGLADSTVAIIDIDPHAAFPDRLIALVSTGGQGRADEADYDLKDHKVYVANSDDGFLTAIDALSNSITRQFTDLGPALEQPRYNARDGMMYLTGSGQNVLFQFDPARDLLVRKIDVGDECHPNGLAINPAANIGLLGCGVADHIVVWDFTNQKVKATLANVGGTDATFYSARVNRFLSASSGFVRGPVIGVFNGDDGAFLSNIPVAPGGHQLGFDDATATVFTGDAAHGAIQMFVLPQVMAAIHSAY